MVFEHWINLLAITTTSLVLGLQLRQRHRAGELIVRAGRLVADAAGIPAYRASLPALRRELDRARRHMHPLTVVVLAPRLDPGVEPRAAQVRMMAFSLVGAIVRDSLRSTDLVAFDSTSNRYVLILPESRKSQSLLATTRLQALLETRAGVSLDAATAEFPGDGVTIEDLFALCIARQGQPTPVPVPAAAIITRTSDERWAISK
jgi:hypothetical protein